MKVSAAKYTLKKSSEEDRIVNEAGEANTVSRSLVNRKILSRRLVRQKHCEGS